jgi:hypothetical protein
MWNLVSTAGWSYAPVSTFFCYGHILPSMPSEIVAFVVAHWEDLAITVFVGLAILGFDYLDIVTYYYLKFCLTELLDLLIKIKY